MGADGRLSLTSLLATYGALVSSLTLCWTLYRDLRDRRNVKFSVEIRRIGVRSDGAFFSIAPNSGIEGASEQLFFVFSMVNVGRRPVRLKNIYAKYKEPVNGKRGIYFSARYLPKSLDEQEALDEYSDFNDRFVSENVETITVSDVSGKQWSLSRKQMRELRTDAVRFLKEEPPAVCTYP